MLLSAMLPTAAPPGVPSLRPDALHPFGLPPTSAVPHDECGVVLALPCETAVEVFALGSDRAMYHRRRNAGNWSDWQPITLPGNMLGGPAATTDGAGRMHVLARGPDHKIWHTQQTPPTGSVALLEHEQEQETLVWSQWRRSGNVSSLSSPTLTVGVDGRVHAFAVGESKGIWHAVAPVCCKEEWHWEPLGGIWASKPAAVVDVAGAIHVFAVGADGGMYTAKLLVAEAAKAAAALGLDDLDGFSERADAAQAAQAPAQAATLAQEWSAWAPMGGRFASEPKISALRTEAGGVRVVARAADKSFHHSALDGAGAWSAWAALPGGPWASGPAMLPLEGGGAELFGRETDLSIWHATMSDDGRRGDLESLGGRFSTGPAVMEDADGLLEVFARGFDQQIWARKQHITGGWAEWESLGGDFLPFAC